jgi:hypothetical protein
MASGDRLWCHPLQCSGRRVESGIGGRRRIRTIRGA